MLTAAALVKNKCLISSDGKKLNLYNTDRIDFGDKSPLNYTFSSAKRNTVEGDVIITRSNGDKVGIDSKYTKETSFRPRDWEEFERELKGVQNNFRSGNLQGFYFASNVPFSESFKNMVNSYNIKIFEDRMKSDTSLGNEAAKNLNANEEKHYIPHEIGRIDFIKNPEAFRETIRNSPGVPQIGLCEKVNFTT